MPTTQRFHSSHSSHFLQGNLFKPCPIFYDYHKKDAALKMEHTARSSTVAIGIVDHCDPRHYIDPSILLGEKESLDSCRIR